MHFLTVLTLSLAVVSAVPTSRQGRINGGSVTTINQYPYLASTLYSRNGLVWVQTCTGTIINNRSILSSASCYSGDPVSRWRIRIGSSYANSGGVIHSVSQIIIHSSYKASTRNNDIAIVRSSTQFVYNTNVAPASIASATYSLPANSVVWALGWGQTAQNAGPSEQLRRVQVWTISDTVCKNNYRAVGFVPTANMICSGWLNVGGRGQCTGDNGGPLIHNNVVVGVFSWGQQCGSAIYPDINAKVSKYTSWIQKNA